MPGAVDSSPGWLCLRNSAATLGDVSIDEKGSEVLARAGKPLRQRVDSTEDDGGEYQFIRYTYAEVEFDVDQRFDDIERLFTNVPAATGPAGIHVGMSAGEVWHRLGISQRTLEKGRWTIPLCGENGFVAGEERIELIFADADGTEHLTSILVVQYGP